MKQVVIILSFCIGVLSYPCIAQSDLCQGNYFTEAQGYDFLKNHTPASLDEWQQRRQKIISNIKAGMDLEQMPAKVSSAPIIHSKKIMDGYTVENVAFESLPGFYVTG